MLFEAEIEGIHKKRPIKVKIKAEYTLSEALGLMKAYPGMAKEMIKVMNKIQGEQNVG